MEPCTLRSCEVEEYSPTIFVHVMLGAVQHCQGASVSSAQGSCDGDATSSEAHPPK